MTMPPLFQLNAPDTVLCIGAHCDDIEIGCGGTLLRWAREWPNTRFVWAVFASDEQRGAESRAAAQMIHAEGRPAEFHFLEFRASYLPAQFAAVKDAFEALRTLVDPGLILTHHRGDRHQDHALLAELSWNTWRDRTILEYEIPKYEGDLGQPNFFVPLDTSDIERKSEILMRCFPSQHARSWFTADTFLALARIRGIECVAPSGYAEAFHARKICT
jgi:LmbE family N-acetylglucosaminyl deacetylase